MKLHPSILHINAKNLKPQTVKMINKMVEKVNEREEIYPINGYAPGNYWCNCHDCKTDFVGDKLAVTCRKCALEAAYVYLTAEITRLREALDKIANPLKFIQEDADKNGMVVDGYQANLLINNASYLKGIAKEALKPDNSK